MRRGNALPRGLAGPLGAVCGLAVVGALLGPAGTAQAAGAAAGAAGDGDRDGLVMVLDSSGSMAGARMAAAGRAVGAVVDALPDGYPTGLRVYGAGKEHGCDDTRLLEPVRPLDREALKQAVAGVRPKGDTPIGLSLRKAAADLPEGGRRTIVLVSDGEDTCGAPEPCEVAARLAGQGADLRIDTVGFQVRGGAREQLECIAATGHGSYYDAPDAASLVRQLTRASRLSADAYRLQGRRVTGGTGATGAPALVPGQYVDDIGPGETRWYAVTLDAASTADLAVTAVPRPGVRAAYGDGVELRLAGTGRYTLTCGSDAAHFGQDEGAMVIGGAVSRIPTDDRDGACDRAGRYVLSVHRTSAAGSDRARWPLELRYGSERPFPAGATPAPAATRYGDPPAAHTGAPHDVEGGTGFNDARRLGTGIWRDTLLPGQTRFYAVRVGWGQRLTYSADFANEPLLEGGSTASSFVATAAYGPGRQPLGDASGASQRRGYHGRPLSVGLGTVPVTWTNRWAAGGSARGARTAGEHYVALSLGPGAAGLARNAAVRVVLRVDVTGTELAGPEYGASARGEPGAGRGEGERAAAGDTDSTAAGAPADAGGFMTVGDAVAAAAGGAVALAGVVAVVLLGRRRRDGA
ncbi:MULTISPECIES: VWA domain-containing protein [unclassified Streptomyces]|uniref:VWA domain-containing protein n=1 Tax=unclassified Streptomyces TaxID=2593676 RepID=UPI000D0AB6E0|nr:MULTISPECIES: VWA domain-containing protein [unclassified Streptomyces]MYX35926.1 VWA domain-containing protein [Streptomyces sp. SID8377]